MLPIQPTIQTDFYKQGHRVMYPAKTELVYSNITARKSRIEGIDQIVVFGVQYFLKEYLKRQWDEGFFDKPWREVERRYLRIIDHTLGKGMVTTEHLKWLHELGYLPLHIECLPEGTVCPIRVPFLTIENTRPEAFWLVNYLESILSCSTWQAITSATIARQYRRIFDSWGWRTARDTAFAKWQGHDFSMRGMSSLESACISGAAHLVYFTGTDTIPAIEFLEEYYGADVTKELVGASVPATEHSVMCFGGKESELETFTRLLDTFAEAPVLSVVSDTWSLPAVVTRILPALKEKIVSRKGKLVIRPDSFWTNPADCICGFDGHHPKMDGMTEAEVRSVRLGLVEALWEVFGGTVNEQGYKVLDPHIGAIYGDSITMESANEICARLAMKGFASTNIVFGIGSYTYQHNTRDTFGFAVKATAGVIDGKDVEVFKDPITDDGMKKSAKGFLHVYKDGDGKYAVADQADRKAYHGKSAMRTVFRDGKHYYDMSLAEVRRNAEESLWR